MSGGPFHKSQTYHICTGCYLGMDADDDDDGITEDMESEELTLADRKAFLALPMEERREILRKQADAVAETYGAEASIEAKAGRRRERETEKGAEA